MGAGPGGDPAWRAALAWRVCRPNLRHRLNSCRGPYARGCVCSPLEEGLRCRDLACVIGEIARQSPKRCPSTASRRLTLTA